MAPRGDREGIYARLELKLSRSGTPHEEATKRFPEFSAQQGKFTKSTNKQFIESIIPAIHKLSNDPQPCAYYNIVRTKI